MPNKKQIFVVGALGVLTIALFSLNIKGLVKHNNPQENTQENSSQSTTDNSATVTLKSVSETAKQTLSAKQVAEIAALEQSLQKAPQDAAIALEKTLAQAWAKVNQVVPSAFYYELIAQKTATYNDWLTAGKQFTIAYENESDSTQAIIWINKANQAYVKSLALQPDAVEAKIGLGNALVLGSDNPMQGIQLLLEVAKADPNNVTVNKTLGLFSMKSGQFEKAIKRFEPVLATQPSGEIWFYLGTSYENLGNKTKAIQAYEQTKKYKTNLGITAFVDKKIKELRNNQ